MTTDKKPTLPAATSEALAAKLRDACKLYKAETVGGPYYVEISLRLAREISTALESKTESLEALEAAVKIRIDECDEDNREWRKEPQDSLTVQRGLLINNSKIIAFQIVLKLIAEERGKA